MILNNTHRGNIEDAATAVLNAFNGWPNKEALALLINSSYGTSFQPARALADWEEAAADKKGEAVPVLIEDDGYILYKTKNRSKAKSRGYYCAVIIKEGGRGNE